MRKSRLDREPDGSFLSRWSRKKAQPESETVLAPEDESSTLHGLTADTNAEELAVPSTVEKSTPEPTLTDKDMPDLDSLGEDSDYSGFMSPGVSEELRKLALRKLFQGAGFNVRDGLDDYDDDFRNFAALGDLITSDMKHQAEMAEKRKQEALEEEAKKLKEQEEASSNDQDNVPQKTEAVGNEHEVGAQSASDNPTPTESPVANGAKSRAMELPHKESDDEK